MATIISLPLASPETPPPPTVVEEGPNAFAINAGRNTAGADINTHLQNTPGEVVVFRLKGLEHDWRDANPWAALDNTNKALTVVFIGEKPRTVITSTDKLLIRSSTTEPHKIVFINCYVVIGAPTNAVELNGASDLFLVDSNFILASISSCLLVGGSCKLVSSGLSGVINAVNNALNPTLEMNTDSLLMVQDGTFYVGNFFSSSMFNQNSTAQPEETASLFINGSNIAITAQASTIVVANRIKITGVPADVAKTIKFQVHRLIIEPYRTRGLAVGPETAPISVLQGGTATTALLPILTGSIHILEVPDTYGRTIPAVAAATHGIISYYDNATTKAITDPPDETSLTLHRVSSSRDVYGKIVSVTTAATGNSMVKGPLT